MQLNNIGIIEAANELRNLLPCNFDEGVSFQDGLKRVLDKYLEIVSSIDRIQFDNLIKNCKLYVTNLTQRRFYNFARRVVDAILGIIDTYLDGNPYEAYDQLQNLFTHSKVLKRGTSRGYVSLWRYLDDEYGNLFSREINFSHAVYRIRIGKNIVANEMYHVPFDKREKVGTYRFSIPGWPAFYVGTSVDVCWAEVKRGINVDENVCVARFLNKKSWILFSLKIPCEFKTISNMESSNDLYYFLCTFPVYAASLVKVKCQNEPFKPEYIVPQMILQYVKTNSPNKYNGIIYSSTKCENSEENPNLNIVIPTTKSSKGNLCEVITSEFKIEDFKAIREGSDKSIRQQLNDFQKNERSK